MKRIILLAGLALSILTGCATAQTPPAAPAPAKSLAAITGADLDVAIGNATAAGDTDAAACYTSLKGWITAAQPTAAPALAAPVGAFSLFEAGRLKVNAVDTLAGKIAAGVPHDVHMACAPVVMDAQALLAKLGLIAVAAPVVAILPVK